MGVTGVPEYRRKPIIVDAEQWWPGKQVEGVCEGCYARGTFDMQPHVHEPDGLRLVKPGDWVVTEPDGRRRVMTREQFAAAYEPVREILPDVLAGPKGDSFDALCEWSVALVEAAGLTDEDLRRIHRRVRERLEREDDFPTLRGRSVEALCEWATAMAKYVGLTPEDSQRILLLVRERLDGAQGR